MKKAFCKINIGDMNQIVFIYNDEDHTTENESLSISFLPAFFAAIEDLNQVKIRGCSKEFIQYIEQRTKEAELALYNKTHIKFI